MTPPSLPFVRQGEEIENGEHMSSYIIEIHPKSSEFDPAARQVRTDLLLHGVAPKEAVVETERLYRIEGEFSASQIETIAYSLLVDPVVETSVIVDLNPKNNKKKTLKKKGSTVDVWLKPGVTDPVGATVVKGLKDLGFKGAMEAFSATRYAFPKIKNEELLKKLARQSLANTLIHDIRIAQYN
jgi:phosphoribosylformylglycinamidine (FGAM) synthase PurS component